MKINELLEARRNPDHPSQKRTAVVDKLWEYTTSENIFEIYISFTGLKKIGINPSSAWCTPNGIYCYPLYSYIVDIKKNGIASTIPYAFEQPYINVLKQTKPLLDVMDYSNDDYKNDVIKLVKLFNLDEKTEKYLNAIPIDSIYSYSYKHLNLALIYIIRILGKDENFYGQAKSIILRKLGYNGLIDRGAGIIHRAEPTQAVFFTTDSFKLLERIDNKITKVDLDIDPDMVSTIPTSKGNIRAAFRRNSSIFISILNGPNGKNIPLDVVRKWIDEVGIPTAKIHLKNTKYARLLDEDK